MYCTSRTCCKRCSQVQHTYGTYRNLSNALGACRASKDGKENADDDLQVASEEGSVSSAGGFRDIPQPRGSSSPRELVQELIDENTRLYEENKRLGGR